MKRRLLVLLVSVFILPGCTTIKDWFTFEDDEGNVPAQLVDIDSSVRIKKLWSTGVGSGQGDGYHQLRPVINGSTIYAAGNDGTVNGMRYSFFFIP